MQYNLTKALHESVMWTGIIVPNFEIKGKWVLCQVVGHANFNFQTKYLQLGFLMISTPQNYTLHLIQLLISQVHVM